MYGYTGKLLSIDLPKKDITIIETPKEYVKSFIGGSGLAARLIYDMVPPDPVSLSSENIL